MLTSGLPVSIIVPVLPERLDLYRFTVAPSIEAMHPAEILPIFQHGTAPQKRNLGKSRAREPYLLFSDDDIIWHRDALGAMLSVLRRSDRSIGYVFMNFMMVNHPTRGTALHDAGAWTADKLRLQNFVSTMSLIRRSAYEQTAGWDENLTRLQDWDLWLQMLSKGIIGQHLPAVGFTALYDPRGITQANGYLQAHQRIKQKHGL